MNKPQLDRGFMGLQIVDGNNFYLNRVQTDAAGLVIRNILADLRACAVPPLFCLDGAGGNARRRAIVPGYKVRTEKELSARENLWPGFLLFKSLLPFVPVVTLEVRGSEADDVMAAVAVNHSGPCRIITTDRDMAQLAVHSHIDITASYPTMPPSEIRLFKTFCGDPSDKLKGVPGFGPKSFDALNKQLAVKFDFVNHGPEQLGMKLKHYEWCRDNTQLLKDYYEIVGFLPVSPAEIASGLKVGMNKPEKVNEILREFML